MTRTMTVKGEGQISLQPDRIEVSVVLTAMKRKYEASVEEAARQLNALRDAVCSVGFSEKDLKTVNFRVDTRYRSVRDDNGDYKNVFMGYACSHDLKLAFEFDTKLLAEVLSTIAGCLAEPEIRISFTVRDTAGAKDALLESAVKNAKHRAEILAKASGVTLGSLLSVDYNWGEINFYSRTNYEMDTNLKMAPMGTAAMEFTPDDITLNDTVTFVWEIL